MLESRHLVALRAEQFEWLFCSKGFVPNPEPPAVVIGSVSKGRFPERLSARNGLAQWRAFSRRAAIVQVLGPTRRFAWEPSKKYEHGIHFDDLKENQNLDRSLAYLNRVAVIGARRDGVLDPIRVSKVHPNGFF